MNKELDKRLMAATIRYARRHIALTGTNPSVGTLIVRFINGCPTIVGHGVTARGGRPHAEPVALVQAGDLARGATAYVTLEPCAHHGATPPCAQTLIDAGIKRVMTGWVDPDSRVDGRGLAMLREAGIEVEAGILGKKARADLGGYLNRKQKNRPYVTVKLAVSVDGHIGQEGMGQIAITGPLARSQVHMMRATHDAILIGSGTATEDDPELTCRLPGMSDRSPHRFVLDSKAGLDVSGKLAKNARTIPTTIVVGPDAPLDKVIELKNVGVSVIQGELVGGRIALPELLNDLAETGISSLFVEGGAQTVRSFLEAELVDEIVLFTGVRKIGTGGIASPLTRNNIPSGFTLARSEQFGDDMLDVYTREQK